jgi:hypothetical protein
VTPERLGQIRANAILLALRYDDDISRAYARDVGDLLDDLARLTPTWHAGEPPQNGAYVWREHPQGATIVEVLSAEDRADYDGEGVCFWDAVDGPVPWGTDTRWCPIEVPK